MLLDMDNFRSGLEHATKRIKSTIDVARSCADFLKFGGHDVELSQKCSEMIFWMTCHLTWLHYREQLNVLILE